MEALGRERGRDTLDESPDAAEIGQRVDELCLASRLDQGAVKKHARCRIPRRKEKGGATTCSPHEWAVAAISAWAADQREGSLSQELPPSEEQGHATEVRDAEGRELAAWSKLHVFVPEKGGAPSGAVARSRWAFTWKQADARASVRARSVASGYEDPDLKDGQVDPPWRRSLHHSQLQVML